MSAKIDDKNGSPSAYSLKRLGTDEAFTSAKPIKRINVGEELDFFLTTSAYYDLKVWIYQLTRASFPVILDDRSIQVRELNSSTSHVQGVVAVQDILSKASLLVDQIPPETGPRRFGNVAFRTWTSSFQTLLDESLNTCLAPVLPDFIDAASTLSELKAYLIASFGSSQRLDYGTGHELSFIAFLGALWKLHVFKDDEEWSIISGCIQPYILLVRKLIKKYTLEPAGSHGVWGLDDHSFIPYILGSAQLSRPISESYTAEALPTEGSLDEAPDPASIMSSATVNEFKSKNFYFGAIAFILEVKKGPFFEHSPYLYNISGIKDGWAKINKGMLKMYDAEVLAKFPVVQHFLFGSMWKWERDPHVEQHSQSASVHRQSQPSSASLAHPSRPSDNGVGTQAPWAKAIASRSNHTGLDQRIQRNANSR